MHAITLLLLLFNQINSSSIVLIKGKVVDAQSQRPVPFATVYLPEKGGTYADSAGNFELLLNDLSSTDTLIASSLGYETTYIPVSGTNFSDLTIPLQRKSEFLDTIIISDKEAMNKVIKALEKIPDNFPTQPFLMDGFYRQTHREDGHWCRLIEAQVDIYDESYGPYRGTELQEFLLVRDLRRSNVNEQNGFKHGDHLVDLLIENIVRYQGGRFTNPPATDKYEFAFDESTSSSVYVIQYTNKNLLEEIIRTGIIEIETGTFAIHRITELSYPNPNYKPSFNEPQDDWIFKEGFKEIKFVKKDEKMWLSEIHQYYKHDIFNFQFYGVEHAVEEYFDMWIVDVGFVKPEMNNGFTKQGNLYSKKYSYNSDKWNLEILKQHPLDIKIKNSLERFESLEEQFDQNAQ